MTETTGGMEVGGEPVLSAVPNLTITRSFIRVAERTIRVRDITALRVETSKDQKAQAGCWTILLGMPIVMIFAQLGVLAFLVALIVYLIVVVMTFLGDKRALQVLTVQIGPQITDQVFQTADPNEMRRVKTLIEELMTDGSRIRFDQAPGTSDRSELIDNHVQDRGSHDGLDRRDPDGLAQKSVMTDEVAEKWSAWKTALLVFVVLLLGGPIAAAGFIYMTTGGAGLEPAASSGSASEPRYRGPYAQAVDQCISHIAGYEGANNNRDEFLRLFDPTAALVLEIEPWSDDGHLRRHVRVEMPRVADGYYEGHYTHRPLTDRAVCYLFERRGVWNSSY